MREMDWHGGRSFGLLFFAAKSYDLAADSMVRALENGCARWTGTEVIGVALFGKILLGLIWYG